MRWGGVVVGCRWGKAGMGEIGWLGGGGLIVGVIEKVGEFLDAVLEFYGWFFIIFKFWGHAGGWGFVDKVILWIFTNLLCCV